MLNHIDVLHIVRVIIYVIVPVPFVIMHLQYGVLFISEHGG